MRHRIALVALAAAALLSSAVSPEPLLSQAAAASANTPKVLTASDYSRWRTIDRAQISADGKYVVYGLRHVNTLPAQARPVIKLRDVAAATEIEIDGASQASFSPDGKWLTYLVEVQPAPRRARDSAPAAPAPATDSTTPPVIGPAPAQPANGGARGPTTVQRRWELRELATGQTQQWKDIASVSFSPSSTHLLLTRRAANAGGGGAGSGAAGGGASAAARGPNAPRGQDHILHNLATGRSLFLGGVDEAAFNVSGQHLAYTVDASARDGNGLFLISLADHRMDALDNDSLRYSRLTWNDNGSAIAVLKGREVEKMREHSNTLLVFSNVAAQPTRAALSIESAADFPKGFVITERASLDWSDDGTLVYLGIMPQTPAPDTARRRSTDSIADVDVWRTQDERIQSQQIMQANQERNRTFRQAFDVRAQRFIALADSSMRDLELPITGTWAVGRDPRSYISDYKSSAADFYRVNTRTGERTPLLTNQLLGANVGGISPDGRYFLYFRDARWHATELASNTTRTLGGSRAPSFVNREYDYPGPRPPYGVEGFTPDGEQVIMRTRYDLWAMSLNGSGSARNITNGTGTREQIVFRQVSFAPIDSSQRRAARVAREIDLSKPVTLSAYGEWTKKSGFYTLNNTQLTPLVFEDAAFSTPNRARDADRVIFTRQTFSQFPDVRLASSTLRDAERISNANPHHSEYKWGKRVLFDYTTRRGVKLQGVLALPDDYKAGQKLPMLVTFYEKNSQTMHRYPTPSFLSGMGGMPVEAVSRGYATMLPDVHFHTGSSHSDMLDAVEAATRKVISMGYVDPARIGVHGHSYGGEGAAFIGTQSKLFAAVGMGAGVTDLFSDFSQSWGWSYQVSGGSGANGNNYYMLGQGRWGFSPWENPERYRSESALTHANKVQVPFLIMHGTADPTVSFTEGMNFYNALRFNGKDAVMLAYPGEGHGLRGLANRKDLTTRYFQFFDHHLRGAPAPKWMTDGVPFIAKDANREPK